MSPIGIWNGLETQDWTLSKSIKRYYTTQEENELLNANLLL